MVVDGGAAAAIADAAGKPVVVDGRGARPDCSLSLLLAR